MSEYGNVGIWKCRNMEMSEYGNVGIWKCRNIDMSEYRYVGITRRPHQINTSISKMEKLQNKASRIISFKHTRSSVHPLYSKCEILKFADNIK